MFPDDLRAGCVFYRHSAPERRYQPEDHHAIVLSQRRYIRTWFHIAHTAHDRLFAGRGTKLCSLLYRPSWFSYRGIQQRRSSTTGNFPNHSWNSSGAIVQVLVDQSRK